MFKRQAEIHGRRWLWLSNRLPWWKRWLLTWLWRDEATYDVAAEHFRGQVLDAWGKSLERIADQQENTPTVDVKRFTPTSMLKASE